MLAPVTWQGFMAAMSLHSLYAGSKGPFKRQTPSISTLFLAVLLKRQTGLFFLFLFLSVFLSPYFSLPSPNSLFSIKLTHKFCLHGVSVPHLPWALTHHMAPFPMYNTCCSTTPTTPNIN